MVPNELNGRTGVLGERYPADFKTDLATCDVENILKYLDIINIPQKYKPNLT